MSLPLNRSTSDQSADSYATTILKFSVLLTLIIFLNPFQDFGEFATTPIDILDRRSSLVCAWLSGVRMQMSVDENEVASP